MPKKTVKKYTEETFEELRHRSAESAARNFTDIKSEVVSQLFGIETKKTDEKEGKNYTSIDDKMREQLGKNYKDQDQKKLDEVRKKLGEHEDPETALKRQFDYMKGEEKRAIESIQQEEMEKKQKMEEEEKQKEEEKKKREQERPPEEPSTKEKRGGLFAVKKKKKKPDPTVENRPSLGKQ